MGGGKDSKSFQAAGAGWGCSKWVVQQRHRQQAAWLPCPFWPASLHPAAAHTHLSRLLRGALQLGLQPRHPPRQLSALGGGGGLGAPCLLQLPLQLSQGRPSGLQLSLNGRGALLRLLPLALRGRL